MIGPVSIQYSTRTRTLYRPRRTVHQRYDEEGEKQVIVVCIEKMRFREREETDSFGTVMRNL